LSVCVGAAAASSLLASIVKGGGGILGLAVDPSLASIGGVGLMLAVAAFRSPLISPFLRVFSTIFAVEYVVTGPASRQSAGHEPESADHVTFKREYLAE
jgi:vitamin B12/bleomycin/antimicrobial peptide transport system ATP-binding/permease protein